MNQKDFKDKSELQIFLSYFKPHRKLFFLDMVCALAIAMIDLAFPFISRWCMYKLLPDNAWRTFWTVMAVVFCAYILRSVFTYIITYWGHTFGVRIETDFRRDLFQHIQELSYAYFDNARVGQLMSQLTSELFDITEFAHHAPEDIFILGMGGELIARILGDSEYIKNKDIRLILQPMTRQAALRRFLLEGGFCIDDERLVDDDGGRIYQIIVAHYDGRRRTADEASLLAGAMILSRGGELCDRYVARLGRELSYSAAGKRKGGDLSAAEADEALAAALCGEGTFEYHVENC